MAVNIEDLKEFGMNLPTLTVPIDIESMAKLTLARAIKEVTGSDCIVNSVKYNKETGKVTCEAVLLTAPMEFEITVKV